MIISMSGQLCRCLFGSVSHKSNQASEDAAVKIGSVCCSPNSRSGVQVLLPRPLSVAWIDDLSCKTFDFWIWSSEFNSLSKSVKVVEKNRVWDAWKRSLELCVADRVDGMGRWFVSWWKTDVVVRVGSSVFWTRMNFHPLLKSWQFSLVALQCIRSPISCAQVLAVHNVSGLFQTTG